MKTVLIISSFVAASRVGAAANAFCLRRLGHETIILPTTLMGRHPGWGDPGGSAVKAAKLRAMWEAVKAQNIKIDAVLTGYMGETAHIDLAADIINVVKANNPKAIILVDPVMGDSGRDNLGGGNKGRLYIPQARAEAIKHTLVPLADYMTPNLWELSYLTGQADWKSAAEIVSAKLLITSVPYDNKIGAAYLGPPFCQVSHERFKSVPNGGGDSLAAIFLAHLLSGDAPVLSMRKAVASVFTVMQATNKNDLGELPLIRTQEAWVNAAPLTPIREIK